MKIKLVNWKWAVSKHNEAFIRKHNATWTNRMFAKRFKCSITTISQYRQYLGLGKLELEMWTDVQVKWLKRLYQHIGDHEIAMIFDEVYPKKKGWTLKHIEKKRLYLKLNRTKEEIAAIRERNKLYGSFKVGSAHSWITRGAAAKGTVKIWGDSKVKYIKSDKGYVLYYRNMWENHKGTIPAGMLVSKIDPDGPDQIDNLKLITRAENALRNKVKHYPQELIETTIALSKLNNLINEKQDKRSKRSPVRSNREAE